MKLILVTIITMISTCIAAQEVRNQTIAAGPALQAAVDSYFVRRMFYTPSAAMTAGHHQFNHLLYPVFARSHQSRLQSLNRQTEAELKLIDRSRLSADDRLTYDILLWKAANDENLVSPLQEYFPFNPIAGRHLQIAQWGTGTYQQPFSTVADYEAWLGRVASFSAWADSAIICFRRGLEAGITLPKLEVQKLIAQLAAFIKTPVEQSAFYGPVRLLPASFSQADRQRLTQAYIEAIQSIIHPTYQKLVDFLQAEYLPAARPTAALGNLPGGADHLRRLVTLEITTEVDLDSVYAYGLREISRIEREMNETLKAIGFNGSLQAYLADAQSNPQSFPYQTGEEIATAYRQIQNRVQPMLSRYFIRFPQTQFEIAAVPNRPSGYTTASYRAGNPLNKTPGTMLVFASEPRRVRTVTEGSLLQMLAGQHQQKMIQAENLTLPLFRRTGSYPGFEYGWSFYIAGLAEEMGFYDTPKKRMDFLQAQMVQALRLVVPYNLHLKGWTPEQAKKYILQYTAMTEELLTTELDFYVSLPARAYSLKLGGLKFWEIRRRCEKILGKDFNIASFHDELLRDGAMPLVVLEKKMEDWARKNRKVHK
ncbi:MAG TPA: DUF885 domain-containing protein [Flavisolibacter sp.]|nr:DUF885 domain-containing protein [Flavisolibacter sp.]